MLVKRIAACTTFNLFPVIQPVSSKVRHFSFAHFGLPSLWVHPWDNRGKCYTWMERGFNAGQTHSSIRYTHLYLQPFTSYSETLDGNCNFFPTPCIKRPLHLTPPLGCSHWNSGKKFGPQKTRIMGLPSGSEDSLTIG